MSVIKNEVPILEYDPNPRAIFAPDHEKLDLVLPKKAVLVFLAEVSDQYACTHQAQQVAQYESVTKTFPVYVVQHQGQEVAIVQAPVGGPAAVAILEFLIAYGVRQVISAGCCGALQDLPENTFIVPSHALRDEGTSYHYLAPSRWVRIHPQALEAIERTLTHHQMSYTEVHTWTTDALYRETKEMVAYRREEGCSVVEMECASLAACAQMRQIIWGQLLFTADTLADLDQYDTRNWGSDSFEKALSLCLDAVVELGESRV